MIDKHIGTIVMVQGACATSQHTGVIRASAIIEGRAEPGTKIYGEEYVRALEYAVREYAPAKEADELLGTICSPALEDRMKIRDLQLEVQRLQQALDGRQRLTSEEMGKKYKAEDRLLWVKQQIETAWKACPDDGLEWLTDIREKLKDI